MNRRHFLQTAAIAGGSALAMPHAWAQTPASPYKKLLVLIELKGANDGLNTVVPFTNPRYADLRPRLAIARDKLLQVSDREALHPSLEPLMPLWQNKELAIVQGLGYPTPNLSHFRSIEIWETASKSDEYLDSGWLARAFAAHPAPRDFAADGVVVGSNEMGPLSGAGARVIALANTEQFLRNAKLAQPNTASRNAALKHLLAVEQEIVHAAAKLNTNFSFKTEFPRTAFGNQMRTAAQLAANKAGVGAIRVTLGGFDTHAGQLGTHANLLKELAEGISALKAALTELNRWNDTLIMTYAEFGRRPKENQSG
ncbi:MAG: DUF1501 domain-containing protein, partial [Betaproteobacteria bacterium]|nr:DUF1501 domain-containing protein [Betaproteobacteria bacterium]